MNNRFRLSKRVLVTLTIAALVLACDPNPLKVRTVPLVTDGGIWLVTVGYREDAQAVSFVVARGTTSKKRVEGITLYEVPFIKNIWVWMAFPDGSIVRLPQGQTTQLYEAVDGLYRHREFAMTRNELTTYLACPDLHFSIDGLIDHVRAMRHSRTI